MLHQRTSFSPLRAIAACALFTALAATAGAQTNIAFYDGTFATGWQAVPAGYSGTSATPTITLAPQTKGGYPIDFLKETHTLAGSDASVLFWVFDPANTFTGNITTLGYSFDAEDRGARDVGYWVALEQNGIVFVPGNPEIQYGILDHKGWAALPNPYFTTGLIASNFCAVTPGFGYSTPLDCTQNPDFVQPVTTTFGYAVANSFIGTGSGSYQSGIDNWCVVIYGASGTATGSGASGPGCGGVTP